MFQIVGNDAATASDNVTANPSLERKKRLVQRLERMNANNPYIGSEDQSNWFPWLWVIQMQILLSVAPHLWG